MLQNMKKKYSHPICEVFPIEANNILASSGSNQLGRTENEPAPLKRLLPLFVKYEELESDIKMNLQHNDYATNYRKLQLWGKIEYLFIVGTYKGEDTCVCFYCQMLHYVGWLMYYNIYELLEPFLMQIRKKENGVYQYYLSPEVRRKMPTFCKLMENARINDRKLTYGLPMIAFLDAEQKYTLLSAGFKYSDNVNENTFDKIHESFLTILTQLTQEADKAGVLNQTYKTLAKIGLKTLLYARHFFNMP